MHKSDKPTLKKKLLRVLWFIGLSLPIVLFLNKFLFQLHGNLPGDWDYFAQLYEASRRSILEFHQFPWWNPWVAGGVPLYGNPQFGLLSVQMPFVLLFGTLAGLRMAVLAYFLIGFWGMRKLLLRLRADSLVAVLLSYIWVFSSFPVWHLAGGHLTFGAYFLAPWFLYFLLNIHKPRGWIWFGLFTAFLLTQSVHYMTIHLLVIGAIVAAYQVSTRYKQDPQKSIWSLLRPYILSACIAFPLALHKLFYTLQYLHDYPRIPGAEGGTPTNVIVSALIFRGTHVLDPATFYKGGFGWSEYASYFGILTLGLFAYLAFRHMEKLRSIKPQSLALIGGIATTLVLALGNFAPLSPYNLLKHLPVFNQMQVASRWLGWFTLGVILFLAALPRRRFIIVILVLSALDVFTSSYGVINYNLGKFNEPKTSSFQQLGFYQAQAGTNSLRFLSATKSNIGDVYGYEPILGFGVYVNEGYVGMSNRCAQNRVRSCDFVLSNNARIQRWSPNEVVLERTAPGDVRINANPGSYWTVNNKRVFKHLRVTELKQDFLLTDTSKVLVLRAEP